MYGLNEEEKEEAEVKVSFKLNGFQEQTNSFPSESRRKRSKGRDQKEKKAWCKRALPITPFLIYICEEL